MKVVEIKTGKRGNVDLADLRAKLGPLSLASCSPTRTPGLFDEHVQEVTNLVHEAGGLMYGDGANFNAILGIVRPGDIGFDFMHYNLHKTFTTPHGGGGPGSGPVGCKKFPAPYPPGPRVDKRAGGTSATETKYFTFIPEKTIGRL